MIQVPWRLSRLLTGFIVLVFAVAFGAEDPRGSLYPSNRLLNVEVMINPADWTALRREHQDLFTKPAPTNGPRPDPYHYFKGTVIIDGQRVENVGIRKKGFLGSANAHRPSLKFNFGKYTPGGQFRGIDMMTLNNNDQDGSQLKQFLAYRLFQAGGVESPRCGLARVTVNGKYLGVYSHVESVDKQFVGGRYASGGGNLYEGQGGDFREGFAHLFDKKTNKKEANFADIQALTVALRADDKDLIAALAKIVDVDQYVRYWAMECLIGHRDSYSGNQNNFLVYHEPVSGQFKFIPWGTDGAFEWRENKYSQFKRPDSVKAEGYLAYRLYRHPEGQVRFRRQLQTFLDTVWDEERWITELKRGADLVREHVHVRPEVFEAGVMGLEQFFKNRRSLLQPELSGPAPEWKLPLRQGQRNAGPLGSLTASFNSRWASPISSTNFEGFIDVEIDGLTRHFVSTNITAAASTNSFRAGFPVITVAGSEEGTDRGMQCFLVIDPDYFTANEDQPVDGYTIFAQLHQTIGTPPQSSRLGYLVGTLKLNTAGTNKGDIVSGTLKANISGSAKPADWKAERKRVARPPE